MSADEDVPAGGAGHASGEEQVAPDTTQEPGSAGGDAVQQRQGADAADALEPSPARPPDASEQEEQLQVQHDDDELQVPAEAPAAPAPPAAPAAAADAAAAEPVATTAAAEPVDARACAAAPPADAPCAARQDDSQRRQTQTQRPARAQHKEAAVERLTEPTAMRMLKQLQQTQGGKAQWHIATGVAFKGKRLSPEAMGAMVDRLCTPKHAEDNLPPKPHAVKLVFEGNQEKLVPVKESTRDDNIAYMANLYERCKETRAKTQQSLQDKWLQPLTKPASRKHKEGSAAATPK